jgi:iron(III) transport system substrate-binding protein
MSTTRMLIALGAWGFAGLAGAQVPADYPADYARVIEGARHEGKVVVYSVLSNKAAAPLVAGFKAAYPGVDVDYDGEGGSNEVTDRFLAEVNAGKPSADVMWSSAMDLQMMLVRDGHAASYASPESRYLPAWARWKDQAWGTTYEPVVFVYNKRLVAESEVPADRAQFAALLDAQRERFAGKVTTFDVARSGVGYLFAAQDARQGGRLPDLLGALGRAHVREAGGTGEMLTKLNSGEALLGYNIMGAYALVRGRKDLPNLGVVMPRDYTLVLSRVMFINKQAPHPNAARLWADFVLSQRGQQIIGDALELYTVRSDVDAQFTAGQLAQRIGAAARPIPIDPRIADDLQPHAQRASIARWKADLAAGVH